MGCRFLETSRRIRVRLDLYPTIIARLDGPLLTLEFAEISGVTGGFGYNSDVRVTGQK
jgi:uncharacterized protein DUF6603